MRAGHRVPLGKALQTDLMARHYHVACHLRCPRLNLIESPWKGLQSQSGVCETLLSLFASHARLEVGWPLWTCVPLGRLIQRRVRHQGGQLLGVLDNSSFAEGVRCIHTVFQSPRKRISFCIRVAGIQDNYRPLVLLSSKPRPSTSPRCSFFIFSTTSKAGFPPYN